jgi:hypothetical protein
VGAVGLIGREPELARLREFLTAAGPRTLVLAGAAGIDLVVAAAIGPDT